jgi:uncharacterized protein YecE (DUF72 family)
MHVIFMNKPGSDQTVVLLFPADLVRVHHQFPKKLWLIPGQETGGDGEAHQGIGKGCVHNSPKGNHSHIQTTVEKENGFVPGTKILLYVYMKKWWIGCSGFYYKGWREKFYPAGLPMSKWFEYYCQFFNTVELNVTFYRFPKLSDLQSWYQRSPEDFKFTVKAPRLITHYKKFKDAKRPTNDFYRTVAKGLDDKLGTVIFQLHPKTEYSDENLHRIISTLDPAFQNVIEFRHESWWNRTVQNTLKENKITFCGISYPDLPDDVMKTSPVVYYRFHGVPKLYLSSYSNRELQNVSDQIKKYRGVEDVYCYFNNDIEVAAVSNARVLQKLTGVSMLQPS